MDLTVRDWALWLVLCVVSFVAMLLLGCEQKRTEAPLHEYRIICEHETTGETVIVYVPLGFRIKETVIVARPTEASLFGQDVEDDKWER